MAETSLDAVKREQKGKQGAKHLRLEGMIPGILYGPGEKPVPLSIDGKVLMTLLHTHGRNVVVNLSLGEKSGNMKTFIYDIQHNPLTGDIVHVDLKRISMKEKIRITIPVNIEGVPVGVKEDAGILEHLMHTLDIQCLPSDIPEKIVVDVSQLRIGNGVHVKDLPHEKFDILSDMDSTVVHVIAPRIVAVEAEVPAVAAEAAEPAEPEVIGQKKEKAEEKEEE